MANFTKLVDRSQFQLSRVWQERLKRHPLKPSFASQYFPLQRKVAKNAEPWIGESGGLVMFKEKMPNPGESIGLYLCRYN
jgi:hypothetical protein